jgi:hypothetical protein
MNPLIRQKNRFFQKATTAVDLIRSGNIDDVIRRFRKTINGGFTPLIDENELKPRYIEALNFLKTQNKQSFIGDYLEFGVCHGSSILLAHNIMKDLNIKDSRLFGFDSFEGLPKETEAEGVWNEGDFYANIENVKKHLSKNNVDWDRLKLIKGWYSKELFDKAKDEYNIKKASLIMIDCDIYFSTKLALDFCQNIISDHCIIFFDDWNSSNLAEKNEGEKKAFDEFLSDNPQFEATEFGSYCYKGDPHGKIFYVKRVN